MKRNGHDIERTPPKPPPQATYAWCKLCGLRGYLENSTEGRSVFDEQCVAIDYDGRRAALARGRP